MVTGEYQPGTAQDAVTASAAVAAGAGGLRVGRVERFLQHERRARRDRPHRHAEAEDGELDRSDSPLKGRGLARRRDAGHHGRGFLGSYD